MEFDGNELKDSLAQAPPSAPTAADADAAKAVGDEDAAGQLAKYATSPAPPPMQPMGQTRMDRTLLSPTQSQRPQAGVPVAPDLGPAQGSLGWHLMNAFSAPAAKAPGGAVKALFSSVSDALLHGRESLTAPWQAATSGQDQSQPTAGSSQGPSRGQRFVNNLNANFGDIAAATEGGPEGGGITGAARVARASSNRTREENKDRQLMATSNAQMLHEQALVHKLGEDAINESITASKKQMDNITESVPGAPPDASGSVIAKDKTSDDLNQMLQPGPDGKSQLDPAEMTVFATGRIMTGKDKNGQPMYRTTYTVVKPAKDVELSPENAAYLNDSLGLKGSEAYSTDPDKLQRLPGTQVNDLFQKANNAKAVKRATAVTDAKDQKIIDEAQNSAASKSLEKSPTFLNALGGHTTLTKDGDPDPYAYAKTYDYIMTHPDVARKIAQETGAANLADALIQRAGGQKTFDDKMTEYNKARQKNTDTTGEMLDTAEKNPKELENNTPAFEAAMNSIIADPKESEDKQLRAKRMLATIQGVKKLELELEGEKEAAKGEAKAKIGRGPESDKVGDEYLATLPKSRQSVVNGIAMGQIPASPSALERTDKGQALMSDIIQAYPDFDASKGETWYKNRNEYMGTGATAKAKINYNTALEHLKDLYTNSTAEGLYQPLSKAYRDRQAAFAIVTNEVGKAVKTGVVTQGEGDELRKALGGWIPSSAKERAAEVGRLLYQKIGQFQQAFDDSAPSKIIKVPTLISPQAQAAHDYVQSGGQASKPPVNAPPGANQRPADLPTATHTQQFTKGGVTKTFWTDVAGKPLREATELPKE